MNKHTPGPWRMRTHDLMQRIETCEGHTVAIPAMNDGVPALSCSANARLIAAAPDLVDLLYHALPCVEESEEFDKPTRPKLSAQIRALIKKIEGE